MSVTRPAAHLGTAGTVTSSLTATLPVHVIGDRLLVYVSGKYDTATLPTCSTPGWTMVKSSTGGTGSAGADTGTVFQTLWAKDAASASETNPVFNAGGTAPNSWVALATVHRPTGGKVWRDAITTNASWVATASDTNTATGLTGSCATTDLATAGDQIQTFGITPQDVSTTITSATVTATGLSGTSVSISGGYVESNLGDDCSAVGATWSNFTGTQTGAIVPTFTLTSATNHSGAVMAAVLREIDGEVMNAGTDLLGVEDGVTATLDSSASTGVSSGRTWSQVAGTTVTLSDVSAVSPSFETPTTLNGDTLRFRVTGNASGAYDEVNVEVLPASRRVKIGGVMRAVRRRITIP